MNTTEYSIAIDAIESVTKKLIAIKKKADKLNCRFLWQFGDVVDIPEERPDTLLIVSAMIRQALPWRKDLASPGDLVRDENGVVIGCKNLIIN